MWRTVFSRGGKYAAIKRQFAKTAGFRARACMRLTNPAETPRGMKYRYRVSLLNADVFAQRRRVIPCIAMSPMISQL